MSIKLVAKRAGVSISTVSRVLNGTKVVSEGLRKRVVEAIELENYRPNPLAKALVNRQSQLVGVIVPRLANNFFPSFIEGLEVIIKNHGYSIMIINTYGDAEEEMKALEQFKIWNVIGIIFCVTSFSEVYEDFFCNNHIPTVFVGQDINKTCYPFFNVNNYEAMREITNHVLERGHRHVGLIKGPDYDISTGILREEGFKAALESHGIEFSEEKVREGNHSIKNGYNLSKSLVEKLPDLTCIVCASDLLAIGCIKYLNSIGLQVPGDISVTGFDDIDIAEVVTPRLTTLRQSPEKIGAAVGNCLLQQLIQGGPSLTKQNFIDYSLVIRDSVDFIK